MNAAPALLDLLGIDWDVKAPVVALAWDATTRGVAGLTADGIVVLAETVWPDGPHLAPRPGGGWVVQRAARAAPEPLRVRGHPHGGLALHADRLGGFLSGGADGRLVHVTAAGRCAQLALQAGAPVAAVASGADGLRAWAAGHGVHRQRPQHAEHLDLPGAVTALAFDPAGRCLAIAHAGGVAVWPSDAPAAGVTRLATAGEPCALAWSTDGTLLACAGDDALLTTWRIADGRAVALAGGPQSPCSLAFAGDGRFLVAGGAPRPLAWRLDPPRADEPPTPCGATGKTAVTRVACHPEHPLVAAGYGHGAIALCRPGHDDALVVKGLGAGEVSALAWSPDGSRLAFGTRDARFGWVHLPADLFRFP